MSKYHFYLQVSITVLLYQRLEGTHCVAVLLPLLLSNCIYQSKYLYSIEVLRGFYTALWSVISPAAAHQAIENLYYGEEGVMLCTDWVYTVCVHLLSVSFWWFLKHFSCLFKMCLSLSGCRHNIVDDVHVWITECGTCLVMLKHPSYTSSVSFCRQPKKQDVNAWRNACSPSQSWAPGIGTRGKRAVVFQTIPLFFLFLSVFPPPGNGLIITPRPMQVSEGVSEWVWGLRGVVGEHGSKQEGEKNREEEESHSWSRNALGGFGEVTGASRERPCWLAGWGWLRRCSHCSGKEGHMGKSKSYLCPFLPLYVPLFPFILTYPSFPQTHE